jgi:hypothetical protein
MEHGTRERAVDRLARPRPGSRHDVRLCDRLRRNLRFPARLRFRPSQPSQNLPGSGKGASGFAGRRQVAALWCNLPARRGRARSVFKPGKHRLFAQTGCERGENQNESRAAHGNASCTRSPGSGNLPSWSAAHRKRRESPIRSSISIGEEPWRTISLKRNLPIYRRYAAHPS